MKKILLFLTTGLLALGCTDNKVEEQKLRDSVIDVHERVMGEDEKVLNNKSALDTLVKRSTDQSVKDSAKIYSGKLLMADSDMSTWMHNFEPDQSGKLHENVMIYFGKQKKLVLHIDSQMNALLKQTNAYLEKTKKK